MNTEIIDAGRDISGGYKVDVSRGDECGPRVVRVVLAAG
jgi:hypothetical protein